MIKTDECLCCGCLVVQRISLFFHTDGLNPESGRRIDGLTLKQAIREIEECTAGGDWDVPVTLFLDGKKFATSVVPRRRRKVEIKPWPNKRLSPLRWLEKA